MKMMVLAKVFQILSGFLNRKETSCSTQCSLHVINDTGGVYQVEDNFLQPGLLCQAATAKALASQSKQI